VEPTPQTGSAALIGREPELELIGSFLDRAAAQGEALLLLGEPGVGKTTLLQAATAAALTADMCVLRAGGVEFEADVSFSALNQALLPLSGQFSALSPLQRDALNVALGFGEGPAPDRLVVSNAALALLRKSAARQPVLVILDDLPWLDRASAGVLGFIARRVTGSRIGVIAASRTGDESFFNRAGLPEYELQPLADDAAARLLSARYPSLAPPVRRRFLREAQGNPLALLELPAALGGPRGAAASPLPAVLPLNRRLQTLFANQVAAFTSQTRQLLLLAALDGTGDLRILRALGPDANGLDDLVPAEQARLARVDETTHQLTFRHPLIRAAVVNLASTDERRRAHRALAELWRDQPDRHAWHLAEAVVVPDEQVALLLEQAANRILRRGDAIGAVEARIRAADLSPAATDRARRLTEAAYIGAEETGEFDSASVLLADARRTDPQLSSSLHAAAAAVFLLINADGDVSTAHRLLVGAIETGDHGYDAANAGLIEALHNLALVCWFGSRPELWEPFDAALARLTPKPPDFLSVLSKTFPDPARTAAAALDEFDALVSNLHDERDPTRIMRIGTASVYVDRLGDSRDGAWQLVQQGREGGPARRHLGSLMHLCLDDFVTGRWEEGYRLAEEGLAVCNAHGYRFFAWYFFYNKAVVEAVRGEFDASRANADEITHWAVPRGVRSAELFAQHPRVLAAIGEGEFESAYQHATALSPAGTLASHVPHALWVAFDITEAAVRTGRQDEANAHVAAMADADIASISSRMALIQHGSAAVAATGERATELYERALATPGASHWQFDHARVQLAFGEHLRRERTMIAARAQLTAAHETFERLDARPWASRAAGELRATGQTKPRAGEFANASLTPQEREIAELAAAGLSNKQIGERLFLSHRTVGNHLHRVFPKLGITSRAALRDALDSLTSDR
jgi:DNA-binding CsgD family transcriptional regulator/energy-coupling factor transporter ATP-binding protein EcfA2